MINSVSKDVKNQALQWYVRLRSPDISDEERQYHSNWLSQNAVHQQAYTAIQQEWQDLDNLESWAITEMRQLQERVVPPKHNRNILFGLAAIGTAALAVTVLIMMQPIVNQFEMHKYETLKGEQRQIVLEDGSRIHLNSASSVSVRFTADAREINLLQGEGFFDVAHVWGRPFIVQVLGSKIVAVGTRFNVYYKNDDIAVTVLEGRVAIVAADTPMETLKEGAALDLDKTGILLGSDQQAQLTIQGEVVEVKAVDAEKLTAWNRGLLILDAMPLREVAEELSRYVVGTIRVASNVPDYPVTGVIKIRDQDTMLQLLSEVVPIIPIRQSTKVTVLYSSANATEKGNSD